METCFHADLHPEMFRGGYFFFLAAGFLAAGFFAAVFFFVAMQLTSNQFINCFLVHARFVATFFLAD